MEFNLLSFDNLLSGLLTKQELEEHLSHVIRYIEDQFDFQSMGIYLKIPNSDTYRMKISRNTSYTFAKNSIFKIDDPMLKELSHFKILDIKPPTKYKFEKKYSHLLVLPLHHNDELLGFIFIDKHNEVFEVEEMTIIKSYASIISLIVQLDLHSVEIEQHRGIYVSERVYSFKAFLERSEVIFSMMKRYKRNLAIAVLKIENCENIVRTIGENKTNDLLKQISHIITSDLRETDIIGKIHNDSFAVLMPETSSEQGIITINRVNKRIMKLPVIKICKICWGIAERDDKIDNAEDLIKFADHAANDSNRNVDSNITIHK